MTITLSYYIFELKGVVVMKENIYTKDVSTLMILNVQNKKRTKKTDLGIGTGVLEPYIHSLNEHIVDFVLVNPIKDKNFKTKESSIKK